VVLLFVAGFLEMMILDNETMKLTTNWTKPNCDCLPGCNELGYSSILTHGNIEPLSVKNNIYGNITRNLNDAYIR
jgi:hypothetical protein